MLKAQSINYRPVTQCGLFNSYRSLSAFLGWFIFLYFVSWVSGCVCTKTGVLLFFCSSQYDLARLPELWIKFEICLDYEANHYQF